MMKLKRNRHIIFEAIGGSHAYGTYIEGSDVDLRGVYIPSLKEIMGFKFKRGEQESDKKNDILYYDIDRFLSLLTSSKLNVLEMLYYPSDGIKVCDAAFKDIVLKNRDIFLTKKVRDSLGGYAVQQIKKARGLNKKIVNEEPKERKTPIDFCFVIYNHRTIPLKEYITGDTWDYVYKTAGVVKIPNAKDMYAMYVPASNQPPYRGIGNESGTSNDLRLSSIPKSVTESSIHVPIILSYSKDRYTQHCKSHKQYWEWVENRNEVRYQTNKKRGAEYDTKNMMHCMRLLKMGIELAEKGVLNVRRHDRDYLLSIRRGEVPYDELLLTAEDLLVKLDLSFKKSDLPEKIDEDVVQDLLYELWERYHGISL